MRTKAASMMAVAMAIAGLWSSTHAAAAAEGTSARPLLQGVRAAHAASAPWNSASSPIPWPATSASAPRPPTTSPPPRPPFPGACAPAGSASQAGAGGSGQPWPPSGNCTDGPRPVPDPAAPHPGDVTVEGVVKASQTGRVYVGYYPSWSDNWFDATGKTPNEVYQASKFARIPGTYTHVMAAFADPNFSWAGLATNSFSGTGMEFSATPKDIKAAIDVLHKRHIKVILAVGGATYNNWGPLAAEGQRGSGPMISALAKFVREMGFDGLDVDYEADGDVDRYANAIKALRSAAHLAGGRRMLALSGWSTGADCTAGTSADASCAGKMSYWGGNAGRERGLVLKHPEVAGMLDMVNVMSYDARYEHYDGVVAYNQYRSLFPSRTIVSIGLQSAPEGWAGANLVVDNADAQCEGSTILQDQYGTAINLPYSVERFTGAVLANTSARRNRRDGAMLWSILKPATGNCGSALLASPGTIGKKVGTSFNLPVDPLLQGAEWK